MIFTIPEILFYTLGIIFIGFGFSNLFAFLKLENLTFLDNTTSRIIVSISGFLLLTFIFKDSFKYLSLLFDHNPILYEEFQFYIRNFENVILQNSSVFIIFFTSQLLWFKTINTNLILKSVLGLIMALTFLFEGVILEFTTQYSNSFIPGKYNCQYDFILTLLIVIVSTIVFSIALFALDKLNKQ